MEVTLERFSLDLARPLETASGTIESRDGVLVFVGTDPTGIGEATPLLGWTEPLARCRSALDEAADALAGDDTEGAYAAVETTPAARHALSLALLDRAARRDANPLYRVLGRDDRVTSVPVNATVGAGDVDRTRGAVDEAVRAGFGCVKVKVGVDAPELDVARLDAVRSAHPSLRIRADANGAWEPEDARTAIRGFAKLDVEYVEQPLAPDDLAGHAELRRRGVGIAADETLIDTAADTVLDAGAADVLVCKPMVLGGIDRARAVATAARRAGRDAVVTTTVDAVVARTAAVHLAASLPGIRESGLATGGRLVGDLAPDPAPVDGGVADVPQSPGIGVDPDVVGP